ncbi:MAG TPA: hypothetical protein VF409_10240 [Sphingomonas sp.]
MTTLWSGDVTATVAAAANTIGNKFVFLLQFGLSPVLRRRLVTIIGIGASNLHPAKKSVVKRAWIEGRTLQGPAGAALCRASVASAARGAKQ